MDYRKATCLYHPNQTITNFCRDRNCLMPLCPSCISDHTQYHQQNQTKPSYFNISQTFNDVQDCLYNTIRCLQQDRKRNLELMTKIKCLDELIQDKILATKAQIFSSIDTAFAQLQAELKKSLSQINEQIGLLCMKKSKAYDYNLTQTIEQLYNIKTGLKSEQFLASMIVFLNDMAIPSNNLHTRMKGYLESNQSYSPKFNVSNEARSAIIYNIARLIKIDTNRINYRQKNIQLQRSHFKGKKYLGDNVDKNERSYTPQKSFSYVQVADPLSNASKVTISKTNNSPYRQRSQKESKFQFRSRRHIDKEMSNQKDNRWQHEESEQRIHSMRRIQNY